MINQKGFNNCVSFLRVVELMQNPAMKNIDPKMVEAILNEVLDAGSVDWHDIAGLEGVKNIIKVNRSTSLIKNLHA